MATFSKRALLANTFGTFGYISCLLQWLFVTVLYLPLLLNNEQLKQFLLPQETGQTAPVIATGPPSPWLIGFAVVFTIFMLIVTLVLLVRAPLSIAKSGRAVTAKAASSIVPLVVHKSLTPAKKRRLTNRLIKMIKLSLVLLPFLCALLSGLFATSLPTDVIIFVSGLLAIGSLGWFLVQYLCARLLKIRLEQLV